jgi:Fic family protein
MVDRASEADEPELIADPDERAKVEAENTLRQFDAAVALLRQWLQNPNRRLKPSDILSLHRVLMDRLSEYAGVYRPAKIKIKGSRHKPPPADEVPGLMEDLCEYLTVNWEGRTAVHLAAYVLWRINWIHPCSDGNGRTARAVSYVVLCAHAGKELPGDLTIPEQIAKNKTPYYKALEAADYALKRGQIDLGELEALMNSLLANQLYDFYQTASGERIEFTDIPPAELHQALEQARLEGAEDREAVLAKSHSEATWLQWVEKHPTFVGLLGVILAAILAKVLGLL